MRTEVEKTVDGEEIEVLVPETAADVKKLEAMAKAGKAEPLGSFAELNDEDEDSLGF